MPHPAPFTSSVLDLQQDWIDYNGHLNMAYYNVLFDRGLEQVLDQLGIGGSYVKTRQLTTYTAEIHVCYVRELHLGDRVTVSFQMLDADEKRVHAYQEIRHTDGWLSATCEVLLLHVDMSGPKVSPFPPDIMPGVDLMLQAHAGLPHPERAGRTIGIKRKS